MNNTWMDILLLDNKIEAWLRFAGIVLVGFALKKVVSHRVADLLYGFIRRHVQGVSVSELRLLMRKPFGVFVLLISLYLASQQIHYPTAWHLAAGNEFGLRMVVWKIFQLGVLLSITWVITRLVDFLGLVWLHRARMTESMTDDQLVPFMKESIKLVVMLFSAFICLGSVFEVNVASLIAGLGIGGIAIALAAKDTLENLLGSFTIFLDKPFTQGDLVKVGQVTGRIEKIGFRSTLVRTLEKSLVTVPNKKMIDAEVENISKREFMRNSTLLLLRHDTPINLIQEFCSRLHQHLLEQDQVIGDPAPSVRLERILEQGLEIHIQYYLRTTEPDEFSAWRAAIHLRTLGLCTELGLRLDSKTQDFHLHG